MTSSGPDAPSTPVPPVPIEREAQPSPVAEEVESGLSGLVVDDWEEPLPGASIELDGAVGAMSDERGRFALPAPETATVSAHVSLEGYRSRAVPLVSGQPNVVVLQQVARVRGTVVEAGAGRGAALVRVGLTPIDDPEAHQEVEADTQGRFVFEDVRVGAVVDLTVTPFGGIGTHRRYQVAAAPKKGYDIWVRRGPDVHVALASSRSGVDEWTLRVAEEDRDPANTRPARGDGAGWRLPAFEPGPGGVEAEAPLWCYVQGAGGSSVVHPMPPETRLGRRRLVLLEEELSVHGTVRDARGRPRPGVRIEPDRIETDEAGRFTLLRASTEPFRLELVDGPGRFVHEIVPELASAAPRELIVELALPHWVAFEGTASGVVGGRSAFVELNGAAKLRTRVGADGSFAFTRVAAGYYDLFVEQGGKREARGRFEVDGSGHARVSLPAISPGAGRAADGGELGELVLAPYDGPARAPISMVDVAWRRSGEGGEPTEREGLAADPDGALRLRVPAGTLDVRLRSRQHPGLTDGGKDWPEIWLEGVAVAPGRSAREPLVVTFSK